MTADMKPPVLIDTVNLLATSQRFVLKLNTPIPHGNGLVQEPAFRCAMTSQELRELVEVAAKALSATNDKRPVGPSN